MGDPRRGAAGEIGVWHSLASDHKPHTTQEDLRQIALSLPGAQEGESGFAFGVLVKDKAKGFVWSWRERMHPKQARVPCTTVIGARTRSVAERHMMIQSDPRV